MGSKGHVLIVDDEESIRYTCRSFLEEEGYRVATAIGFNDAVEMISASPVDLVFIDVILDGRSGLDVLKEIKRRLPDTEAIIITGVPSIETAAEAMRLGALDYIMKPLRQDALLEATEMAFRHRERKASGEARRKALEAILGSVEDAVIAVDDELSILASNAAAGRLCGLPCDGATGTRLERWLSGCAGACLQPLRDAVASGTSARLPHVECRTERNPEQIVDVVLSPLTALDGTLSGGVLVIREQFTA